MKLGTAIANSVKVCLRSNYYKIHGKPWDVKDGGDIDNIRHRIGKFLCPIRESLGLPYLRKAADKSEEVWACD